ncbi:hypothetical protein A1O3_08497 [Capronia epimyces CBS 606.96]|uniref:Uncharacterized protein n=1 Tax=Capronia epimyces CBS 606.96 TaxID=1182542 RepID=W9XPU6_9EURO|nr:uncharacterized protein A1O3_08497 [Capronia epimyces CBS 606.96]EXJ78996.1 hypothetical protein A1O3_08497 [Capronia epimyces CBS 606.96]
MSKPAPAVTYGRGGAGNVTVKSARSPKFEPESTPTLKSKTYTTGRGGAGNMAKNDPKHPEEARRAQDVDVPGITLPEGSYHTGRGGVANTYKPTERELQAAKAHNEKVRTESFNRQGSEDRGVVRALAKKANEGVATKHEGEK